MKVRLLLGLILALTLISVVKGQSTAVSATITDSGGQAWINGTYTFTSAALGQTPITGTLDGSGAFASVTFPHNSFTAAVGDIWTAKICPDATSGCFVKAVAISGATQSLSSTLIPAAISLSIPFYPAAISTIRAYADAEITATPKGGAYYSTTSNAMRVCTTVSGTACTAWVASGGGGGASYGTGGGTAQAQTVTPTPTVTALTVGLNVCWLPIAANTAAAPTLTIAALAAKPVTKYGTVALVANDITTLGIACAIYDGTEFQLQNPLTGPALAVLPTSPNNVPYILTSTPAAGVATQPVYGLGGIVGRAVTGVTATDTITSTDCNNDVDYQGSVSVNPITVPTATTLGIAGCVLILHNDTTGGSTLTVVPTSWQVKVNGAAAGANFTLAVGQRARMIVDAAGSLWDAEVINASSITGSVTSVAHTMPGQFSVAGTPVTGSGTLADTYLDPYKNLAIDVLAPFQVLQSQRRTTTILAQGQGAYNAMGDSATETSTASTNVAPTASAPVQSQETTTGTISTAAGLAGNPIHRTGRTNGITLLIGSQQNVSTNDRTTRCLTDQTLATQVGSDVPAGNYACITFSTTGTYTGLTDTTHYVCLTKDNTTQNAAASTVLGDTAYHVFGIREDIPNSSYHFYIDFVEVCGTGITLHIPTTGTNMRYVSAAWDLTASAVLLNNAFVQIVEDK